MRLADHTLRIDKSYRRSWNKNRKVAQIIRKRIMSSSKPFVLFFNPVSHAVSFYQQLQQVAHTEVVTSKSREEFFKDVADKYKNIFAIYRTSASGAVSTLQCCLA